MLPFFPTPRPNQLFYSICSSFHERSCNSLYAHTAHDLFGSETVTVLTLFPSNLNYLCSQLHPNSLINPDMLISKHTLFPLYKPFLSKERAEAAIQSMKNSTTGDASSKVTGVLRYNLLAERSFKYCPTCFDEDCETYGEALWHRDHQHFGVLTCYAHGSLLIDTGLPLSPSQTRREFYLLDKKYPPKGAVHKYSPKQMDHIRYITEAIHWLLNNEVPDNSMEILYRNYDCLLIEKGYAHARSSIMSHDRVTKAFTKFYGQSFLELMSCDFSAATHNWLVNLLKKRDTVTEPLRHILAIRFLGEEVQNMLSGVLVR